MNQLCHRYLNQNILPLSGRDEDLELLEKQFEVFLRNGTSTFSLVGGGIGIGKSRLIKELETTISKELAEEVVIVHARYLEGNVAALTPILNAFLATISHHSSLSGVLAHLTGGTSASAPFASDTPTLQMLLDAFQETAKRFALVLILEDIHNLDDLSSLDQLFLGLSSISKHVVFTYRMTDAHGVGKGVDHYVRELSLREECPLRTVALHALRSDDVIRLIRLMFEIEPSAELVRHVEQLTHGRPLELRSSLRNLIAQGVLQYNHGVWSEDLLAAASASSIAAEPESVLINRFQQELERLSNEEQAVALHASWLGEQFDLRLLKQALQNDPSVPAMEDDVFHRAVQLLTFKSIIRKATPSIIFAPAGSISPTTETSNAQNCYEFSHPHFWNTILATSRSQVAGRHDLVLRIASFAAESNLPVYSSIFLSISGSPFAIPKSESALATVESFLQWSSAVAQGLWSLEPQQTLRFLIAVRPIRDDITWRFGPELSEPAMRSLLELHSMLVEAIMRGGSWAEAEKELEHAAVLEKFISSRPSESEFSMQFQCLARGKVATLRAITAVTKGNTLEFERWSDLAHRALHSMDAANIERARLLCMLARTKAERFLVTGNLQEADQLLQANLELARSLVDERLDEYSLFYRLAINSKLKQGKDAEASELIQQIIEQARQRRDTITETTFLYQACVAAFSTGHVREAIRFVDQGMIYGRRYGIRFAEIMSNIWRMILAGVELDVEKVKECTGNLDAITAQSSNLLWRISYIEGRATTMNFLGRHQSALDFAEEAIRLADSNEYHSFAAWAHNERGLALIGLGRFSEAHETATQCLELSGQQLMSVRMARTVLAAAEAGLGNAARAEDEIAIVRPLFNDKNPYYLRLLQVEARMRRAQLQTALVRGNKQELRSALQSKAKEMLDLAREWSMPKLEASILEEYKDILDSTDLAPAEVHAFSAPVTKEADPAILHLCTIGAFEVIAPGDPGRQTEDDKGPRRGRDSKVKQLIAMLVVARFEKRQLTKENLADRLWPDSDGAAATASLHTAVKRARLLMGLQESINFSEGNYELSPQVSTDIEALFVESEEIRQLQKKGATFAVAFRYETMLRQLSKGAFFEGLDGMYLDAIRSRLEALKRHIVERLLSINIDRGLLEKAETLCYDLFKEDEFDEQALKSLLMIAAKRKQVSRIPAIFDSYVSRYRKEFKSDPDPDLKKYTESLLAA